jgi:uncharacterized protein (UPF0332 family)
MSAEVTPELRRALRELEAARVLARSGFGSQAISRAYYAAFFAAEAALLAIGESRSRHSGVISAFGRYVVRERGLDATHGRALATLFDKRNAADYGLAEATDGDARAAVDAAAHLVEAVTVWLAQQR